MKKFLTLTLLAGAAVLLAACGKLNFDSGSSSTSGTKTGSYQTTGTVDNSMYQGVIKNGRYQTSSARGLTLQQNDQRENNFNIKSMESGLENLAKAQFPTDKYSLTAFGIWCNLISNSDICKGSAHHHFMVSSPGTIRVKLLFWDTVLRQISSRRCMLPNRTRR